MKKYLSTITLISLLFLSCNKTKQDDLLQIPVDIDQNISMQLSEITEEIIAIDLELTDESLINTHLIKRVHILKML